MNDLFEDASDEQAASSTAVEPTGPRRNVVVGMASWTDPSLIKTKRFYPPGHSSSEKRLRYYASQFPMVEVDSSFFAMPTDVAAWECWKQASASRS
jgi:uncharacterized protein YecE (DUF72 family)